MLCLDVDGCRWVSSKMVLPYPRPRQQVVGAARLPPALVAGMAALPRTGSRDTAMGPIRNYGSADGLAVVARSPFTSRSLPLRLLARGANPWSAVPGVWEDTMTASPNNNVASRMCPACGYSLQGCAEAEDGVTCSECG